MSDKTEEPPAISASSSKSADAEEKEVVSPYEGISKHIQPLYDSGDLLGFAICSEENEVLLNETFLNREGVSKATDYFIANYEEMEASERSVKRVIIEMDDIIIIHYRMKEGHGMFIFASDADIDVAGKLIAELDPKE